MVFLTPLINCATVEGGNRNVIKCFNKTDEKACTHTFLKLREEPAALITSLLMSGGTTKLIWNKMKDSYQMENIQSKLNLRTQLNTIKYVSNVHIEDHITGLEELFLSMLVSTIQWMKWTNQGYSYVSYPKSWDF